MPLDLSYLVKDISIFLIKLTKENQPYKSDSIYYKSGELFTELSTFLGLLQWEISTSKIGRESIFGSRAASLIC